MKSIAKLLLLGAVATAFIAVSAVPSDAAKKRKKMAAKKPAACVVGSVCAANCAGGMCQMHFCGADGKRYISWVPPICLQGLCPAAC